MDLTKETILHITVIFNIQRNVYRADSQGLDANAEHYFNIKNKSHKNKHRQKYWDSHKTRIMQKYWNIQTGTADYPVKKKIKNLVKEAKTNRK